MDSFYLPLGDGRWSSTVHTTGPWDARFQHGGPPPALLARAVEQCAPRDDVLVARMTVEILGPVPATCQRSSGGSRRAASTSPERPPCGPG